MPAETPARPLRTLDSTACDTPSFRAAAPTLKPSWTPSTASKTAVAKVPSRLQRVPPPPRVVAHPAFVLVDAILPIGSRDGRPQARDGASTAPIHGPWPAAGPPAASPRPVTSVGAHGCRRHCRSGLPLVPSTRHCWSRASASKTSQVPLSPKSRWRPRITRCRPLPTGRPQPASGPPHMPIQAAADGRRDQPVPTTAIMTAPEAAEPT